MRIKHTILAPMYTVYSETAFESQVGEKVRVEVRGEIMEGILRDAIVLDLGQRVEITLDVPELLLKIGPEESTFSIEGELDTTFSLRPLRAALAALDPTEAPEPVAEFTEAMYGPGQGTTP